MLRGVVGWEHAIERWATDYNAGTPSYLLTLLHRCRENREAMDKIVEVLIEKETIDGKEFRAMLAEYTELPKEAIKAAVNPEPETQIMVM